LCQSPFGNFFHILQVLSDICVVFKQLAAFLILWAFNPLNLFKH